MKWNSFSNRPAPSIQPTIVCLIPAHNEEKTIQATVRSVFAQEVPVDLVIVLCDNCTDDTQLMASEAGAVTYVTRNNTAMKAGALNQALSLLLPSLEDHDLVMAVDADSIVGNNFTSEAVARFNTYVTLGGVSGTYQGKSGGGLVGWCQRNEFARWGFDNKKQHGHTVILSGAASIFRVQALRRVIKAREEGKLAGRGIGVYNSTVLTEDFELSLALVATGHSILNMMNVHIETAIKPSWRQLYVQRLRWDRGINESLFDYGFNRTTRVVWLRRVMYALFIPVSFFCLIAIGMRIGAGQAWAISPFWLVVSGIMMTQKAATIRKARGWRNALTAFAVLPELPYDTFLQLTFVRSLWDQAIGRSKRWR